MILWYIVQTTTPETTLCFTDSQLDDDDCNGLRLEINDFFNRAATRKREPRSEGRGNGGVFGGLVVPELDR